MAAQGMEETFTNFHVQPTYPVDHYFAPTNNNNTNDKNNKRKHVPSATISKGAEEKIMQEWKLLQCHLPPTIYVRVYENHISLMRAAIVGVPGTPYHNGLFFFDIAFPRNYPTSPPHVHYKSFGFRLNPNLYSDGTVCLSLLNTWDGKGRERWDKRESNILQLLLSLQALVLNENPVFNEPDNDTWLFRRLNAYATTSPYNENAFYLTCKTMSFLIRKPPGGYEGLVASHFRANGREILSAVKAYVGESVKIGCYSSCSSSSNERNDRVRVSKTFKDLMVGLYPEMVARFRQCGAEVGDLVTLQIKHQRDESCVRRVFGMFPCFKWLNNKKKSLHE